MAVPENRVQKLKYLRIKETDGTIYGDIPLAIDAENVTMQNKNDLQSTVGDIDYTVEDDITTNLRRLKQDVQNINNSIQNLDINVDSELSETSTHPVENRAIYQSLQQAIASLSLHRPQILFDTKDNWNQQYDLIGKKDTVYIYTDYKEDDQGNPVAGIKIGDGNAYLIDAPFITEAVSNIKIDSELSSISKNPLENQAIHAALSNLAQSLSLNRPEVLFNTKEGWSLQGNLVGKENTIYVYTNYQKDEDNHDIAGIKIGDGNAYLIDLPFLDTLYLAHIQNNNIHITEEERRRWNEKVRCFYSLTDEETLIFTTN